MPRENPGRSAGPEAFRLTTDASRRTILKWSGFAAVAAAAAGIMPGLTRSAFAQQTVDLGGGDIGVLNYAYALEQLEAAFYTQVMATPYGNMSDAEATILGDIRDHEVAHREFFASALGSAAIPGLEVDFSGIDFNNRESVLGTAMAFEDLGVSAYNGAGRLLTTPDYLVAAGRIVSVEARHAAIIRDFLDPLSGDFAGDDIIDRNGLDLAREPGAVLRIADPFIATPVSANSL